MCGVRYMPGRIMVGRRKGSHGAGQLALPGGHLELNETWYECVSREVAEETGLELLSDTANHIFTSNDRMPNDKHYITIFIQAQAKPGSVPQNLEPHKCEGWLFMTPDELLRESAVLFPPLLALLQAGWRPGKVAKAGKARCPGGGGAGKVCPVALGIFAAGVVVGAVLSRVCLRNT